MKQDIDALVRNTVSKRSIQSHKIAKRDAGDNICKTQGEEHYQNKLKTATDFANTVSILFHYCSYLRSVDS